MNWMQISVLIAISVTFGGYILHYVFLALMRLRDQKSGSAPVKGKQIIPCRTCHAKLRVPVNKGNLMVHCPKCGAEFVYDSGPKPWSPASAFTAKPPKKTPPPQAPKAPPPQAPKAPLDELDNYRPGGPLREEINQHPTHTREALLNLIATWSAASLRIFLYDRTSGLWDMVRESGGSVESASLELDPSQLKLDYRFSGAPLPGHTFQYTYNEIANKEGDAPIHLSQDEIQWVRCATLSHLADIVPQARMKNGRLLP